MVLAADANLTDTDSSRIRHMKPILPSNPGTITPQTWPTETIEDCEKRLEHLRRLDTHHRRTDAAREAEKAELELRIKLLSPPTPQGSRHMTSTLDKETLAKVAMAGELLIRAAAAIGSLTPKQQESLQQATDGSLPDSLLFALNSASRISEQTRDSLRSHPPAGISNIDQSSALTAKNHAGWLRRKGFELQSTGGGFVAWQRAFPSGRSVLVTNLQQNDEFTSDDEQTIVCAYDQDFQPMGEGWEGPLNEAAAAVEEFSGIALTDGLKATDTDALVKSALNAAARDIQDALGVTAGDDAGVFFTGQNDEQIRGVLRKYVEFQVNQMKDEFAQPAEEQRSTGTERHGP